MTPKDASLYNQLFKLPPQWGAVLDLYSVETLRFAIEYRSSVMTCPLCGVQTQVVRQREITWNPRDYLGYKIIMTAKVPVVAPHNPGCRVDRDQAVLVNTLFLDLILRQVDFTQIYNPFLYFFTAAEASPTLSLPRLDDEARRLSPYLQTATIEESHDH